MSINQHATADDFTKWTKAAKAATLDVLNYVVKDCREAAEAMRGWNAAREGYYADQAFTYSDERSRRARAAAKRGA